MNLKKVSLRNFRSFGNIPHTFYIDDYEMVLDELPSGINYLERIDIYSHGP